MCHNSHNSLFKHTLYSISQVTIARQNLAQNTIDK